MSSVLMCNAYLYLIELQTLLTYKENQAEISCMVVPQTHSITATNLMTKS